ncbi:hypothetical protein MMU07_03145 [Aquiflexum sp. LQ15W]|uniref:hypothetical protein n=1 Tax=Cognataquiflexum nitidum TaxID=2922272 RepID=UPI001F136E7A|nr:hypothetical protein [Cognataquiflexum nitidum]MCH6198561.1 hypothetical protein [Cognataquiflexum nitidum]
MLEQLKEIKEKLNQLIQEVEQLENSIHGEEIIIERKDFKFIKRVSRIADSDSHLFRYLNGVFFRLYGISPSILLGESLSLELKYEYSIFKALQENRLQKIVLLKLKEPVTTKNGSIITHKIEQEIDSKLRENYRVK